MKVAIHQPNFLPWLGYFDKMVRADVFVLLDNIALQKTGGNYTNRAQFLVGGAAHWLTVPVSRGTDARARVDQATIAEDGRWRRKIKTTLEQAYARAAYFGELMPRLKEVLDTPTDRLCEFNLAGVYFLAERLGVPQDKLRRASRLDVEGASTDLLISIVKAVGGTVYLCGAGARGYQDDEKFRAAGIEVEYQNFRPRAYPQGRREDFVPGLSAVDALMHCGDAAASLIGDASRADDEAKAAWPAF
jgi:WbqC-like protein family